MKKILSPLLIILLFTGCQKQISPDKVSEEIVDPAANKQAKINVCHYDAVTGTSKTIEVAQNALSGHLRHGDLPGDCSTVLTTICNQDWMVKNLNVDHYRNGDLIPQVSDLTAWVGLTTGAWCYYENNSVNGPIYGKLYNWYAVNDPRGLAPLGWHVPTDVEWTILSNCLGGQAVAGGKMKSTGTIEAGTGLWLSPNTAANDSSGFTGLPGGIRTGTGAIDFSSFNRGGYWWSSSEGSTDRAWSRLATFTTSFLERSAFFEQPGFLKLHGMSVRCLRD